MLDYHEIGVTTFLIRGYDPYEDLEGYREVTSLIRDGVIRRGVDDVSRGPASDDLESDPAGPGLGRVRGRRQDTARDDR
jgi:hypothetical protein